MRACLFTFALLLLAAPGWGDAAPPLTLDRALSLALSRDALVRAAEQGLADAQAGLVKVGSHTVTLTANSGTSASSSAGLDPQSEITGTSYTSWGYSSALSMPMSGGAQVGLTTSANTSTTNSALKAGGGTSYSFAGTSVGLGYAQPLPLLRNEKVLTEGPRWSAALGVQQAQLALADAKRKVASDTLDQFFAALKAQRQVAIAQASQQEEEELLRIAQAKFEHGKLAEVDVLEAKVDAVKAGVTARSAASDAQTALDALKDELGIPLDQEMQVTYDETQVEHPTLVESALVSRALAQRPDVQELALGLKQDDLSLRQAEAQSRPGVVLTGTYSLAGQALTLAQSWSQLTNPSWFLGFATSLDLTRRADRAAIRDARSHVRLDQVQQQTYRDQVRLEIRDLMRKVQDASDAAGVLAETVKAAEENVRVRQLQLEHGLIRPIDVTQTERDLMDTRNQYLDAVIDYELTRAKLTLAVGDKLPAGGPS